MKDPSPEEGLLEDIKAVGSCGCTSRGRRWGVEDRKRLAGGYIIHKEIVKHGVQPCLSTRKHQHYIIIKLLKQDFYFCFSSLSCHPALMG